ncbi:MAG: hypothetical protein AAGD11_07715, partial [Planctomycetota bacterium]
VTLEQAANLVISGTAGPVIAPGNLGAASVSFPVNSRTDTLPTTFEYDPSDFLGNFAGTIEHSGSVLFNSDAIEVGDFTIGFDVARAAGQASGFFVESTVGIQEILFDIANPAVDATDNDLEIGADLLVSPEFAQVLIDVSLTSSNLTGADVGDALVQATVPEPTSGCLAAIAMASWAVRRKRVAVDC